MGLENIGAADPDPGWIRVQLGVWIRIQILANKVGNEEISFIFERGGCSLKVRHEGLRPQLPVLPHMVKI